MKKSNKKQRGFALIEVMMAALVLTVGGVAYMKLQQTGLQYGFNNSARSQGVALVGGFVEQLRSNIGYLRTTGLNGTGTFSSSFKGGSVSEPTDAVNCDSENNTADCGKAIFDLHSYLTSEQMTSIVPKDNSLLCYTESKTNSGMLRVTFKWRDNSELGKDVDLDNCPAFNENIEQNNSVTIYVQL